MLGGAGDVGADLPAVSDKELDRFWARFDAAAPIHLRAGFSIATTLFARILPRLLGHRRGLGSLRRADQDRVLAVGARLPSGEALVDLIKLVASFAYFSVTDVDAAFRAGLR